MSIPDPVLSISGRSAAVTRPFAKYSAPVAGENEGGPVSRGEARLALGQFLVLLAEAATLALLEDGQLGASECLGARDDDVGVPGSLVELAHQRLCGPVVH